MGPKLLQGPDEFLEGTCLIGLLPSLACPPSMVCPCRGSQRPGLPGRQQQGLPPALLVQRKPYSSWVTEDALQSHSPLSQVA